MFNVNSSNSLFSAKVKVNYFNELDYIFTDQSQNTSVWQLSDSANLNLQLSPLDYTNIPQTESVVLNEYGVDERLTFKYTLPNAKLYYPEPFIASPSYLHSDLYFLNILQYWYWLWFIFVYLIIFFFISFLSVVRWCSTHKRPRRETRGVSRSKCGDLITACVPVSWAASIIVSESTDTSDLNDGFGTGEIVVGVRAYQWGWEYYYPKKIDLLYNVTPSYSTFVGNSLKYNHTSGTTSSTNNFWKQYQTKSQDSPIIPASVVFNTLSSLDDAPQTNFDQVGVNTLKLSASFPRIRNNTKIYNTHLLITPTNYAHHSYNLNTLYSSPNDFLSSTDFGITRTTNFLPAISTVTNSESTIDSSSFEKFLDVQTNKTPFSTTLTEKPNKALISGNKWDYNLTLFSTPNDFLTSSDRLSTPTIADSEDKILPTDQSLQQQQFINPNKSYDFFTKTLTNHKNNFLSDNTNSLSALSHRIFTNTPSSPLTSTSHQRNRFTNSFYEGTAFNEQLSYNPTKVKSHLDELTSSSISANSGSPDKIPTPLSELYWSTSWFNLNTPLRLSFLSKYNRDSNGSYFPTFNLYADYDFRNEQAVTLLEDLFWESSYSSYNFYDYISTFESLKTPLTPTPIVDESLNWYTPINMNSPETLITANKSLQNPTNMLNIQSDELFIQPKTIKLAQFATLPLLSELNETEDAYSQAKQYATRLQSLNSNILTVSNIFNSTTSSTKVFNQFSASFQDFGWLENHQKNTYTNDLINYYMGWQLGYTENYSQVKPQSFISSNPLKESLKIRLSVRDSIINNNAFQKVFRSRLDENRAHISTSHFATTSVEQPFINDKSVPYTSLLGKNRFFFYQTPFYNKTFTANTNAITSLYTQNNTQMFEFPFLDATQSDLIRYTWMDGYSKWIYVDVQPSSVSRYSTLNVPYLRKPYDFNTNSSDTFSDLDTYYMRASRTRRNYLPNWLYSPILFTRQFLLNQTDSLLINLSSTTNELGSLLFTMNLIDSLSFNKIYTLDHTNVISGSLSGNNIHGKSTQRMFSGVNSYFSETTNFLDILTKREHLLRDYWFSKKNTIYLPKKFVAIPENPILRELIASFQFEDPLNFANEYSRDYFYSSLTYFKFLQFKSLATLLTNSTQLLPLNSSTFNKYILFYFMNNDSKSTSNMSNLYRNQFRPLRKGVNSMLRLHSTGAVAMPIEMRLQILASSKDVIHSWAIPSASIKIDCIPGYTSHRIMKFLITGVYWGQCQEICGRYHHWMPIVVYFINRDLFFLWCTHFIYKPAHYDSWNISDRKFANFVRFVSYDKSSWLTEISNH